MVRDGDQAAAFGVSTCSAFQEGDQPLPLDGRYRDLPDLVIMIIWGLIMIEVSMNGQRLGGRCRGASFERARSCVCGGLVNVKCGKSSPALGLADPFSTREWLEDVDGFTFSPCVVAQCRR